MEPVADLTERRKAPLIDRPGIYDFTAEEYHADPCPEPSLSSHVANTLLERSAAHAKNEHPKLNPALEREDEEKFDLGTAAHAYILQGESGVELVDAKDWRTGAAKDARAAARKAGRLPILKYRWDAILDMAGAIRSQLYAYEETPTPLMKGAAERTLVWQEGPIWCRARPDWLHDDWLMVDDLKTTAGSANPETWLRILYQTGCDLQAAFYLRGLKAVAKSLGKPLQRDPQWRFVVVENTAPFALSVISLTPASLALAERKVEKAIAIWTDCLATDRWPGYPTRTCYVEIPSYLESQWLQRELAEVA